VVSFNTGTTESMGHDDAPDDGYTGAHAATSDAWYGDGLAWRPAMDATQRFLAEVEPELVAFQEIFHADRCVDIPDDHHDDFVCEDWAAGDPTVALQVLGPGYQVACHPGKDDKCLAVRTDWGRVRGCDDDLCLEGLAGATVDGCGSGARVARAVIEDADGRELLTVVSVHGTSGISVDEQACRVAQIDQVFVDLGDGVPGANGSRNLVMGDLNTDPGRFADFDASAAAWSARVASSELAFISAVGPDAPGSYQGLADIDHVLSDGHAGDCWHAGIDPHPAVIDAVYFDHKPVVCEITAD
jgi:endonuclease/exonuclease/phosphatase family metal-dependent hydrolase